MAVNVNYFKIYACYILKIIWFSYITEHKKQNKKNAQKWKYILWATIAEWENDINKITIPTNKEYEWNSTIGRVPS